MKLQLWHFSSSQDEWAQAAEDLYRKKLSVFADFEIRHLKPKKIPRDAAELKKTAESDFLLQEIEESDFLVLFDERGKEMDSLAFSKQVEKIRQSGKKRVIFLIGGAFGVDEQVRRRSQVQIKLSPMVMNHLVAKTMVLEQLYRAFTIIKGLPYHNP